MAHQQGRPAPERNRGVIRVILEQDAGFTAWLSDQFGSILKNFKQLESTMGKLEDYAAEIKASQDETKTHVAEIGTDVTTLLAKIDELVAGGGGLTPEQDALLASIRDDAKSIAASVKAVDEMAPVQSPVPAPDPEPAPALPAANPAAGL